MSANGKSAKGLDVLSLIAAETAGVPDETVIDDIFAERSTKHADDAIDYEDIDELADDDEFSDNGALDQQLGALSEDALGGAFEEDLQNDANNEFDALFEGDDGNEDDGVDANIHNHEFPQSDLNLELLDQHSDTDVLHGMGDTAGYDHDGLQDLDLGFEEDQSRFAITDQSSHHIKQTKPLRKRRSPEELAAKTTKLRKLVSALESSRKVRLVHKFFPDYSKEKPYNFHTMITPEVKYYAYKRPAVAMRSHIKPLIPLKATLEMDHDHRKAFKSRKAFASLTGNSTGITNITQKDLDLLQKLLEQGEELYKIETLPILERDGIENDKFGEFSKDLILATADWDDHSIMSAGGSEDEGLPKPSEPVTEKFTGQEINYDDENVFNGQIAPEKFELDMNDPHLLFVPDNRRIESTKSKALVPENNKLLQMKFNISNDSAYDILKNNYNTKVRSQLSNLNIEHSVPALRLQTPYYKIKLSKEEARAFHRARFPVIQGSLICFSKLRVKKKKNHRGKTPQEIFSKTSDLAATDSATLIAMEYSEERPNVLSNFGMGSKLINYYRKEKEDDNSRPKAPLGETHVLGVEDRSPFWNFGHVAKGDFVPTLYNNMIRAPIFKQEPRLTDFLLIRSQGCGNHQRYFLRKMDHLFAVGNLFPAVEVPAPHSRKVTNTSKNRLKMIVYRTMNRNGTARLSVKDISSHFPDQNDMQNRQRLKEFMEYQRQGDDQGFWKVRGMDHVPTEEEIRAMISPEDATLLDCMQHGQQVLYDIDSLCNNDTRKSGIKRDRPEKEVSELEERREAERKRKEKEADLSETVDEGLAPWSASRSFIISNQTKAMLQLNGEGDPTGIGLGFSFLRATQKHGFKPLIPPPKENVPKNATAAYQQKLFENEVSRIWYGQRSSLTVDDTDGHSLDDVYREYKPMDHLEYMKEKVRKETEERIKTEGPQQAAQTVLKITRLVRDENDIVQRRVEYIHDPRLIKAYIKRKKEIEGDKMSMADFNEIIPTNDAEMNKIRRKALEEKIANLQKRAKLSKGRKPNKESIHLAAASGGTVIDANTVMLPDGSLAYGGKGIGKGKSTNRRCTSCGAYGHIRTNKACPLYIETKGGTIQISLEQKAIILASVKSQDGGDFGQSEAETPNTFRHAAGSPSG